jgi:hypothetical protein
VLVYREVWACRGTLLTKLDNNHFEVAIAATSGYYEAVRRVGKWWDILSKVRFSFGFELRVPCALSLSKCGPVIRIQSLKGGPKSSRLRKIFQETISRLYALIAQV